jgi:hypothetical protein
VGKADYQRTYAQALLQEHGLTVLTVGLVLLDQAANRCADRRARNTST